MRFLLGGAFCGLCALGLRSDRGFGAGGFGVACLLRKPKTGRRLCSPEGELRGAGDEGGLDRGGSSEKTTGESRGLDAGGADDSRVGEEVLGVGEIARAAASGLSTLIPTRLRFAGGSPL